MADTFNQEANINCTSSRVTINLNFLLVPSQILFDVTDIIRNTMQKGDPEEIAHLQFHLGTLFPDNAPPPLTLQDLISGIVDPFIEKDPDKMLQVYLHLTVLMGCKKLNPTL